MTTASVEAAPVRRLALSPPERRAVVAMGTVIVLLHVAGWGLFAHALTQQAHGSGTGLFGLGTGVLAYTLGMRHAFDADHIAAIDNTTRQLMDAPSRPLGVGFFFSLGHSSVVCALALALNFGIKGLDDQVRHGSSGLHTATGVIGTSVSGAFLYLIALLNAVVLVSLWRVYGDMKAGRADDAALEAQLQRRGLMNRFFGGYARRIDRPWKIYPVGVLFGLGFDTATEIGLLVLAGSAVAGGLPFLAIVSLPLLFAAGMTLFDTLDGLFMNLAYAWAFAKPIRKIFYNLTVTGLSVFVALFIGSIELLGLIGREAGFHDPFWSFFRTFNINAAGFVILGAFALTWAGAMAYWRLARVEERWDCRQAARGREA